MLHDPRNEKRAGMYLPLDLKNCGGILVSLSRGVK